MPKSSTQPPHPPSGRRGELISHRWSPHRCSRSHFLRMSNTICKFQASRGLISNNPSNHKWACEDNEHNCAHCIFIASSTKMSPNPFTSPGGEGNSSATGGLHTDVLKSTLLENVSHKLNFKHQGASSATAHDKAMTHS